jgi:hypothetical protein
MQLQLLDGITPRIIMCTGALLKQDIMYAFRLFFRCLDRDSGCNKLGPSRNYTCPADCSVPFTLKLSGHKLNCAPPGISYSRHLSAWIRSRTLGAFRDLLIYLRDLNNSRLVFWSSGHCDDTFPTLYSSCSCCHHDQGPHKSYFMVRVATIWQDATYLTQLDAVMLMRNLR